MTPKDFDENFDDGDDLVADGFFDDACIVTACISIAFFIVFIAFLWRS